MEFLIYSGPSPRVVVASHNITMKRHEPTLVPEGLATRLVEERPQHFHRPATPSRATKPITTAARGGTD